MCLPLVPKCLEETHVPWCPHLFPRDLKRWQNHPSHLNSSCGRFFLLWNLANPVTSREVPPAQPL